jgi:hypothetical protein
MAEAGDDMETTSMSSTFIEVAERDVKSFDGGRGDA